MNKSGVGELGRVIFRLRKEDTRNRKASLVSQSIMYRGLLDRTEEKMISVEILVTLVHEGRLSEN